MHFKVYTDASGAVDEYTGDARYEPPAVGGGVLTAWRDDGTKILYSPTGWLRLEVPSDARPKPTVQRPQAPRTSGRGREDSEP